MTDPQRYVDRLGNAIDESTWQHLQSILDYRYVRRYKSGVDTVCVAWTGQSPGMLYLFTVHKFGVMINELTQYCASEQEAINLYEHHLAEHHGCYFVPSALNASGISLVEQGNELSANPTQVDLREHERLASVEVNPDYASW
jgi:hypothetical protein